MLNKAAQLPDTQYWASVPTEELPDALAAQCSMFWEQLSTTGLLEVWRRSHRTWFGVDSQGGWGDSVAVQYGGDSGEFVMVRANHYRSIGQAIASMATGMRPAFEARSINVDSKALREAPLATGIVDYTYRQHSLEDKVNTQTEHAVRYAEGWIHLRWDNRAGRPRVKTQRPVYDDSGQPMSETVEQPLLDAMGMPVMDPMTGMPATQMAEQPMLEDWTENEGDIAPQLMMPHEVVRDLGRTDHRWMAVPCRENAWELAARYPQQRTELLALRGGEQWPASLWGESGWQKPAKGNDELCGWYLYVVPNDALPQGRFAHVVGELVLADEPFPFEEIPVYEQRPMSQDGTAQGYSPMWDLLCLQEVYDAVLSSIISQAEAGAGGNVTAPKGSDVSVEQLSRAFTLIEYEPTPGVEGGGRPEPVEFWKISESHIRLTELLEKLHETLSGINSVVRGNPESNLKSGAALALVQSLSAHFVSNAQRENARGHERVGTGILRLYKRFAAGKRVAEISGRGNRTALREWQKGDLSRIDRVTIELGNPLMRQRSGLMQLAETLLANDMFENRDEFLLFLDTGRLEPAYDEPKRRHLQIESENEAILDGEPVKALWGDDHPLHIRRHLSLLDDPDARFDDELVNRVAAHITEHKTLWFGMDPAIAAALGVQPPPMPMPPPGAEGPMPPGGEGEGPPPDAPPPPSDEAPGRAVVGGMPGGESGGDMPFMPTNPLTGQRAPATPNV